MPNLSDSLNYLDYLPRVAILQDEHSQNEPIIALLLVILLLGGIVALAYFLARRWSSGGYEFRKSSRFSKDKLAHAYAYLSADMLKRDVVDVLEKSKYVHSYIHRYFPDSFDDFSLFFRHVMSDSVSPVKVTVWIKTHLNHKDRLQVMYFLAGMAFVDGSINQREMTLLRYLQQQLSIKPKEFDQIIAMYTQRRDRSRSQSSSSRSQSQSKSRTSAKPRKSTLQLAYEVLGVPVNAPWDQVKKAYRKLVKLHHPDRFASASEEQQQIAQERFIEIQKAYEVLEAGR